MLKEDIRIGDMLQTDIDPPNAKHDHFHPSRPVLVLSLDASEYTPSEGFVVVLDCGIRISIGCVWLWPSDYSRDWE
jgi:hypothetical protein